MSNNTKSYPQSLPHGYRLKGKKHEYVIDRPLGQGAFGITYLARYKQQFKGEIGSGTVWSQVCIKEFFMKDMNSRDGKTGSLRDASDNSLISRYRRAFFREARNLSRMQHPNIVNVFEVIEANNTAYIVMEYKDGGSVDEYIVRKGHLSEDEALRLFQLLCDAICYMHAQNMLHLDLKPKNVMLDEEGTPFLIDFGLSKQYTADGETESSTSIGLGTPGYAPSEQAEQRDGDKSFRATIDVYALGGTLYKMLTGDTPPKASEVSETVLDGTDLIRQNLLATGVSAKTAAVVSKAMHPSSRKRYQSISELMASLDWTAKAYDYSTTVASSAGGNRFAETEETVSIDEETHIVDEKPQPTSQQVNTSLVHNNHEYVDLGLSVMWATCNIDSNNAFDYGGLYAFGEMYPEECYEHNDTSDNTTEETSKDIATPMIDDCTFVPLKPKLGVLDKSDDAAAQRWGGNWHIPTNIEWQELTEKCVWKWKNTNGHNGYEVISKLNGNSIFLPSAGCCYYKSRYYENIYGYYWSSLKSRPGCAWYLNFDSLSLFRNDNYRFNGFSVRPVCSL